MKENENYESAAAVQPENTQHVEATEAPDTHAGSGETVERPGDDQPRDGEGCESVTVVIVCRNPQYGELAARSVEKFLKGADADVHVVTEENLRDTLPETLLEHLPHVKTDRLVLMTDGMLILNPVTLADIAVIKAVSTGKILDYDVAAPVMLRKSVLEAFLPEMIADMPHASLATLYFQAVHPEVRPIPVGDWKTDPFVLPVVSEHPNMTVLGEMAGWKKFIHIGNDIWPEEVVGFLEDRLSV